MNVTLARILNGVGRTLIGAGLIILLFVAYQLWGTNVQEGRSQDRAAATFENKLAEIDKVDPEAIKAALATTTGATGANGPPATIPRQIVELFAPAPGEPMALIRIPKIEVEKVVIAGTEIDDLRKGPGHYSETPLPGQKGNAAIAGHRTTYGAPFHNIDQLVPGDTIEVTTVLGTVSYTVDQEPFVVDPSQVDVLDNKNDNRLTLTSCHPKFSAEQRLIVTAKLVGEPLPDLPPEISNKAIETFSTTTTPEFVAAPTLPPSTIPGAPASEPTTATTLPVDTSSTTAPAGTAAPTSAAEDPALTVADPDLDQGLAGDSSRVLPAIGWGLVCLAIGLVAWFAARMWRAKDPSHRFRPYLAYAVATPAFLFFLYLCFENVDRVLPAY